MGRPEFDGMAVLSAVGLSRSKALIQVMSKKPSVIISSGDLNMQGWLPPAPHTNEFLQVVLKVRAGTSGLCVAWEGLSKAGPQTPDHPSPAQSVCILMREREKPLRPQLRLH